MADEGKDPETMSAAQHGLNAVQLAVSLIPYVGPVVEKGVFGVLQERRMNRLTATLNEIAERLSKVERTTYVHSEHFQAAVVALAPLIADARADPKRRMLRDFLLHAAVTPPDDASWDEAELAMRFLREIDAPGLAMIGAAGHLGAEWIVFRHEADVYAWAPGKDDKRNEPPPNDAPRVLVPFSVPVLREWMRRMTGQGSLAMFTNGEIGTDYFSMAVAPNASLVIRWALWSDD